MAPTAAAAQVESAGLAKGRALTATTGPLVLFDNLKVFGIACFACLGGLLYGYNQGVFSGVLTMTSFKERTFTHPQLFSRVEYWLLHPADMEDYAEDKAGLGAWLGVITSGFVAESLSRKIRHPCECVHLHHWGCYSSYGHHRWST